MTPGWPSACWTDVSRRGGVRQRRCGMPVGWYASRAGPNCDSCVRSRWWRTEPIPTALPQARNPRAGAGLGRRGRGTPALGGTTSLPMSCSAFVGGLPGSGVAGRLWCVVHGRCVHIQLPDDALAQLAAAHLTGASLSWSRKSVRRLACRPMGHVRSAGAFPPDRSSALPAGGVLGVRPGAGSHCLLFLPRCPVRVGLSPSRRCCVSPSVHWEVRALGGHEGAHVERVQIP